MRDTDNYKELTFPELADGLVEVDTAGWAEPWEQLSDGFADLQLLPKKWKLLAEAMLWLS